jgi:hypothetical protein
VLSAAADRLLQFVPGLVEPNSGGNRKPRGARVSHAFNYAYSRSFHAGGYVIASDPWHYSFDAAGCYPGSFGASGYADMRRLGWRSFGPSSQWTEHCVGESSLRTAMTERSALLSDHFRNLSLGPPAPATPVARSAGRAIRSIVAGLA